MILVAGASGRPPSRATSSTAAATAARGCGPRRCVSLGAAGAVLRLQSPQRASVLRPLAHADPEGAPQPPVRLCPRAGVV